MGRQTREWVYQFRGDCTFPATGAGVPWVKTDTSSAGAPTMLGLLGGGVRLLLASDVEAENLCLSFGNVLAFDIDDIIRFWVIAKTPIATLDSTTQMAWGMSSNRHDTIDSIAEHLLFRCIGNNDVVVESDDGTTDLDDKPTGLTLGSSWKRFECDLASRNTTIEPPSVSKGRKSNVEFYGSNSLGSRRRVASGTRFDVSAYTGGLQPIIQLQKSSDSNVDALDILEFGVEYNLPA